MKKHLLLIGLIAGQLLYTVIILIAGIRFLFFIWRLKQSRLALGGYSDSSWGNECTTEIEG